MYGCSSHRGRDISDEVGNAVAKIKAQRSQPNTAPPQGFGFLEKSQMSFATEDAQRRLESGLTGTSDPARLRDILLALAEQSTNEIAAAGFAQAAAGFAQAVAIRDQRHHHGLGH